MKACKQEELREDLDTVCTFYWDNFEKDLLHSQLQTFGIHFRTVEEPAALM